VKATPVEEFLLSEVALSWLFRGKLTANNNQYKQHILQTSIKDSILAGNNAAYSGFLYN
jgi:hypothetical protein